MSFEQALTFTLREEGGYVDDPDDHGGATNHGVTQKTYDGYRKARKLTPCDVRDIGDREVADLYQQLFWLPAHCDELAAPLGICHLDWAVNHGVPGAIRTLQGALTLPVDGVFGPATRAAADAMVPMDAVSHYLELRCAWYLAYSQANPRQAKFLPGWLGRVERLRAYLEKST